VGHVTAENELGDIAAAGLGVILILQIVAFQISANGNSPLLFTQPPTAAHMVAEKQEIPEKAPPEDPAG
jgi:hypothetical protein